MPKHSFIKEKPMRGREMNTKIIPDNMFDTMKLVSAKKTLKDESLAPELEKPKEGGVSLYHEGYVGDKRYLVPDENLQIMADDVHAQLRLRGLRDLSGAPRPSFERSDHQRATLKLQSLTQRASLFESSSSGSHLSTPSKDTSDKDSSDDDEPEWNKKELLDSDPSKIETINYDPKERKVWDPSKEFLEPKEDRDWEPKDKGDSKPMVAEERIWDQKQEGEGFPTTEEYDQKERQVWDPDKEFLEPREDSGMKPRKSRDSESSVEPHTDPMGKIGLQPMMEETDPMGKIGLQPMEEPIEDEEEEEPQDDGDSQKYKEAFKKPGPEIAPDPYRLRLLISGHFRENKKPIYLIQEYREEVDLFKEQKADFQSKRKLADDGIDANISGRFYDRTILQEAGGEPVALDVRPERILIDRSKTAVYDDHFQRVYPMESVDVILNGEFLRSDITKRITPFLSLGVRNRGSAEKMDSSKSGYGNAATTVFTCKLNPVMPFSDKL